MHTARTKRSRLFVLESICISLRSSQNSRFNHCYENNNLTQEQCFDLTQQVNWQRIFICNTYYSHMISYLWMISNDVQNNSIQFDHEIIFIFFKIEEKYIYQTLWKLSCSSFHPNWLFLAFCMYCTRQFHLSHPSRSCGARTYIARI